MQNAAAASADDLWPELLRLILPRERLTVSEFAARHRWLANEGGGYVGTWDNSKAPYLTEPMDCLTSLDFLTIALVGPGQCGKTSVSENWMLRSVAADPGNLLWFMQTDQALEAYVKSRIDVMIDTHEPLRASLGRRPVDDSIHFKKFRTMSVEFLSATAKNLISKSAPRIVADEIDSYPPSIGNVKPLLDVRRQTFGKESMLLITSHPDLAHGMNPERDWTDGVMGVYADSDRRVWYWPCPHCGAWSSPCPAADRYMPIEYPEGGTLDEVQDGAALACPVNGCVIADKERAGMNAHGRWVGLGQEMSIDGVVAGELVRRDTAGFWIVGAMSPFILGGIGALARARVKAEREFEVSGEDETLRQVMVKQWGFPYVQPRTFGTVTANDLADRAEAALKLRAVPRGVRFLTAAWDVQLGYFDVIVRGWGVRGESWIVDRYRVQADAAARPEDWDRMVDRVLLAAYPLEGYPRFAMPIRAVGFDSGGAPGVTRQAYDAWTRWRRAARVRPYGQIDGREAWSVVPMKGASLLSAPRLRVTYPDTSDRKDRQASSGTVPVATFNPNLFKDDLAGQLQRAAGGPWAVHFPAELRSPEGAHEWFEQLVSERRQPAGRWEKANRSARNEAMDLMVMNHALAHLHGVSKINWDQPPSWAAEWESNTFLVPAEKVAPRAEKGHTAPQDSTGPGVHVVAAPSKKSKIHKLAH